MSNEVFMFVIGFALTFFAIGCGYVAGIFWCAGSKFAAALYGLAPVIALVLLIVWSVL